VECARTLYRSKTTLAWITGLGIVAAALVSMIQPRVYQSQASVEIQPVNDNFLNLRDVYPTDGASTDGTVVNVQTQADLLQQDTLLEKVVRKLRLEDRDEFQGYSALWNK